VLRKLRNRARTTAETFIAGLGASGGLVAGALVGFLVLIALVTFDAWPKAAGGLFGTDTVQVVDEAAGTSGAADAAQTAAAKAGSSSKAEAGGSANGGPGSSSENGGGDGDGGGLGGSAPDQNTSSGGSGGGGGSGGSGGSSGGGGSGGSTSLSQGVQDATSGVGTTVNDVTGTDLGDSVSGVGNQVGGTLNGLGL
jgi:hypothetical protein